MDLTHLSTLRVSRYRFVLPCLLVLAGCSTSSQPEAPKPPQI
ncbi:hypothetical protein ACUOA8_49360, partial [Escherichia sp. SS-MK2]